MLKTIIIPSLAMLIGTLATGFVMAYTILTAAGLI